MGPEAHPDPKKRDMTGVISGVIYAVIGIFAGTVTALFSAFPNEVVAGIAGLALLGTVASCLHKALHFESDREASFVTFAVTASGLTLFGIGPAFWGILAGLFTQFLLVTPLFKLHSIRK
jgi:benzoate membrane transport protein